MRCSARYPHTYRNGLHALQGFPFSFQIATRSIRMDSGDCQNDSLKCVAVPGAVAVFLRNELSPHSANYPSFRTALRNTSRHAWISGDGSLGLASYSMLM